MAGLHERVMGFIDGGPPDQSYFGGSQQELDRQRRGLGSQAQQAGQLGMPMVAQGGNSLEQAQGYAGQDRTAALGYTSQGQGIGQQGMLGQQQALGNARGMAGQSTDSLAQLQLRQNMGQLRSSMMANAAQARGGNQAAAMRNAQAQGAAMGLQTNQQAAMLRAQEQQAALGRRLAVEQMAAQMGGQQAALGYGMQGQGLGLGQQATGQLGQLGMQQGQLGVAQQNVGLGAQGLLNDVNRSQLETDRAQSSADYLARSPYGALAAFGGAWNSFSGGGGGK